MRRLLLLLVTALVIPASGVTAAPAEAQTSCPWAGRHYIMNYWNQQYVTAELSYQNDIYALLRARTGGNSLGSWELFDIVCVQGPDVYAIKSVANGRYVSAELGWGEPYYGSLRARATAIGAWERFRIPYTATTTLRSTANGRYVSAELSRTGSFYAMLRARAGTVGVWEYFIIY